MTVRQAQEATIAVTGKSNISVRKLHDVSISGRALYRRGGLLYAAVYCKRTSRWYLTGDYEVESVG